METRDVRVIVETEQRRIVGTLQLPRDGYRSRVTDFLNASDRRGFIALTDVELSPLGGPVSGSGSDRRAFVALSVSHVVLAMEADAPAE